MDARKVTLVSVLFMGYLTSRFLVVAFPFMDILFSAIWNGIMMEYLGYSVFIYYLLYCVPVVLYTYTATQQFLDSLLLVNKLPLNVKLPDHPLIIPIVFLTFICQNFVYSWLVHRALKKHGCFRFLF